MNSFLAFLFRLPNPTSKPQQKHTSYLCAKYVTHNMCFTGKITCINIMCHQEPMWLCVQHNQLLIDEESRDKTHRLPKVLIIPIEITVFIFSLSRSLSLVWNGQGSVGKTLCHITYFLCSNQDLASGDLLWWPSVKSNRTTYVQSWWRTVVDE